LLSKDKIRFIGKYDLSRFGLIRWLAHLFDIIPIKRNTQDMEAMKRSLKALKNNEILGIFPEGTRNGIDKQVKAKNGAVFMAMRAGVPIVPVGIQGTFKPFTKIVLNYGKPITLEQYNMQNKEDLETATKVVMDDIIMLTNKKK
jgi:1-acyl-sn-glycerol-3-phosphate acyltransferase